MKSNIYKFTRTFIIFFMLCISSLSSCKLNTDDSSSKEAEHNFKMQRLYYEEPSFKCRNYTLSVKVFADGYCCTNCGTKYHTNEKWKYYKNGQEGATNLTALFRGTGLSAGEASNLAYRKQLGIQSNLNDYYYSLGFEKTSCDTKCTK